MDGRGRGDDQVKKAIFAALALLTVMFVAILLIRQFGGPPSKSSVARHFRENRQVYEQLRGMFLEEKDDIATIARFGVQTRHSLKTTPGTAAMSPDRYNTYLTLLSRIDARLISRFRGRTCILMWRAGRGDAIHLFVCGLDSDTQIEPEDPDHAFQFYVLDGRWYIQTDWGPDRFGY